MVDEGVSFAVPIPLRVRLPRLAESGFVAFLLLIFIGLSPFALRDPALMAAGENAWAGDGLRQLCFASVFAWVAIAAWREQGLRMTAAIPASLAALLLWCWISASWSPEAGVTLRRAALATIIVLCALLSMRSLGEERCFKLLRRVLALVLIVNWLSIPLVAQAVHLPGEIDPGLIGDWRGLYFQKNIAGGVCALTAIVFLFSAWDRRSIADLAFGAAATVFLVMTSSKSSLALLPAALVAGVLWRLACRSALDRWIVAIGLTLIVLIVSAMAVVECDAIAHWISDPSQFTGRAEIWRAEFAFAADHPWFGSGFGSFSDTGALSPLHHYSASGWVDRAAHGHNAYLELLVTIGGTGLALALLALIVSPLVAFRRMGARDAVLVAVFAFMVLHNLLESDFLEGDSPAWVSYLLVLGALHAKRPEPRRDVVQ
jgi:O-antigen ligase